MTTLKTYSVAGDDTNDYLDSVNSLDFQLYYSEQHELFQIKCRYGVHTLTMLDLNKAEGKGNLIPIRYYLGGSSLENSTNTVSDVVYYKQADASFILLNLALFREKFIHMITEEFLSKVQKRNLSGYFNFDPIDPSAHGDFNKPCIRRGRYIQKGNDKFEILLGFSIQKLYFYGRVQNNKGEVHKFDSEDLEQTLRGLSTEVLYLIF